MLTGTTPGTVRKIKGSVIYLTIKPEECGEPERAEFRVKEFCQTKDGLQVDLWSKKHDKLFKSTITDPKEVVSEHKMSLDVVSHVLKQILRNTADNVTTSLTGKNGKSVLEIWAAVESKIFEKTVIYDFVYKFPLVEVSDHERLEIKLLEIENEVAELKREQAENRLRAIEERLEEIRFSSRLIPGKAEVEARFDVSCNNHTSVSNKGITIEHITGQGKWNTTPLDFKMKIGEAYRAQFRMEGQVDNIMIGVISSSFSLYQSYPQGGGYYGWVAYFYSGNLKSSYQHNGSFQIYSNGPAPLKGSIVTVELCTKEGWIQYFVDGTAAGLHKGCTFGTATRFAVALYTLKDKVALLSLEHLQDDC